MKPAEVYKKGVPEWLNSTLWASSRPSVGSPVSAQKSPPIPSLPDRPAISALPDTPEIRIPEKGSKSSENSVPEVEESAEVIGDTHGTEENKLKIEASDTGTISADAESKPNGHLERNVAETERAQSSCWGSQLDGSTDLVNPEGPLPSPSITASSTSTIFTTAFAATRSSCFDSRVNQFQNELSKRVISIIDVQRLASQGVPDSGSIRAMSWKLLLGYLPKSRDLWSAELEKKRAEYAAFKKELLVTPSEVTRRNEDNALDIYERESPGLLPRHDITQDDHPLSLGKSSIWHQFFLDSEVFEQIDRDVKRTHPDMHFFCGDSAASLDNQEAMKRVLFIFAKLNPGIRYVQGMNEVLAPLYYVFKTDTDEAISTNAEADSFFCFVSLLGDFRDHFVQQLDNSAVGIRSTIGRLSELLKRHDEELWCHLELITKVNPQFYAFRWITLLLTQEFTFPDSLRLWDSLLGNPDGPLEILLRVCCAMLMSVRSRLLAGDFASNLKLLQRYPSIDVHHLIRVADDLKPKA